MDALERGDPGGGALVVRCVGGVVAAGDRLHPESGGRADRGFVLRRIEKYPGVFWDALTPPHAARVELAGADPRALRRGDVLVVIGAASGPG
ncbi:hypothetical protein [Streptomyces zhihengii]